MFILYTDRECVCVCVRANVMRDVQRDSFARDADAAERVVVAIQQNIVSCPEHAMDISSGVFTMVALIVRLLLIALLFNSIEVHFLFAFLCIDSNIIVLDTLVWYSSYSVR